MVCGCPIQELRDPSMYIVSTVARPVCRWGDNAFVTRRIVFRVQKGESGDEIHTPVV